MTREEVYKKLFKDAYENEMMRLTKDINLLVEGEVVLYGSVEGIQEALGIWHDKACRLANIHAVKHTENTYRLLRNS